MRIKIGTNNIVYDGWENIEFDKINLTSTNEWENLFEEGSIDAILAEHIWEHMTYEEGLEAAKNCYKFLKPGGYIRCAVPDQNFKDEWYQNIIKVGGLGHINHHSIDHKIVYDYKTFKKLFESAGFKVKLLEYCDEDGDFHFVKWDEADGMINRSYRFDKRNTKNTLKIVSIIIDAKKEL